MLKQLIRLFAWSFTAGFLIYLSYCSLVTPARAETVWCSNARVVDGDTLDCGGRRVRLRDVDAPEAYTKKGRDSTRWLKDQTRNRSVSCQISYDDVYGRGVGICSTRSARDLGSRAINQGYAKRSYYRGKYQRRR